MYIILVLPYLLRDIAGPELKRINAQAAGAQQIDDPCVKVVETLLVFLRWFFLIRRPEHTMDEIVEGMHRGKAMMEALKDTFPEKSGEKMAWCFPKFHDIIHIPLWIILLGWIENFSGQQGERGHKELLKSLAGCINNHDVFKQYLRFWERAEQLSRARREASDSDSCPDSGARSDRARDEAMHACELGVRCPLYFMALHRKELHHVPGSKSKWGGGKSEGRQRLNVWLLRDSQAKAVKEHLILRRLPAELASFAYMFARATLGLPGPDDRSGTPSVEELNTVLQRNLCADNRGNHLGTFGCVELESEKCLGVQRVRCYPFSFDKFHGANPQQYVGLVPPERYSGIAFKDFDLGIARHREQMWVGRVELLFTASFRSARGEAFQFNLAFLSCLYDFEHPSAMGPLQRRSGARMFYVPSTPWTIVLPINHILGRVPLMRLYLQGSTEPTIPHSFARDKELYFEHGCADRAGRGNVGTGSRLYELNVHLWQFGRPQPRSMSVSERLQRKEERQRVSAARKQHKRTRAQAGHASAKRAREAP